MNKKVLFAGFLIIFCVSCRNVESVFIEAESFIDQGGWVNDQQSMDQMGSAYLMAHGLGVPVEDAGTDAEIPESGEYRAWVRTRD